MDIPRIISQRMTATIGHQKVILLFGSIRTGKTTIIDSLATQYGNDVLMLQGVDMQINEILNIRTIANYQQLTRGKKWIIIDEAQAVQNIGPILKLMLVQIKKITILAWQVGSEVRTTELGNALQISKNTVERYLDLLH